MTPSYSGAAIRPLPDGSTGPEHRAALYVAGRMYARHPNRVKQRTELAVLLDTLGLLDVLRDTAEVSRP